jgi:hypothetical protein
MSDYANALLALTPPDMLIEGTSPRKQTGVTPDQLARMARNGHRTGAIQAGGAELMA